MDGCQAAGQFALALAGASQHAQPDNQLEPELHAIQRAPTRAAQTSLTSHRHNG
jgi:hypothetical protein